MSPTKIEKKLKKLDGQRSRLLEQILGQGKMVRGSLYEMRRRCGKPNCRCARGELHASWYLSRAIEGRTRLTYVGSSVPKSLSERVSRYQRYQKLLARIRKMDREISSILNAFRDANTDTL